MAAPVVPLDRLYAVQVETWRRFFEAFGYPAGLSPDAASHDAIGLALDPPPSAGGLTAAHPPELVARLGELGELASFQGREALYDAAYAGSVDTAGWPREQGDAELVARLMLEARARPELREVLAMARIDLRQTTRPRPFRRYAARPRSNAARATTVAPRDLAELAAAVDAFGVSRGRAWRTAARACADAAAPSALVVEIVRDEPPRSRLAVGREPTRSAEGAQGASTDVIRLSPAGDRLAILTHQPRLLPLYRRWGGRLLCGDEDHFGTTATVNLRVLQERGAGALDVPALAATVVRARVIRLVHDDGHRLMTTVEGPDVFAELARAGTPLTRGTVVAATIRVTLASGEPASVDVSLRIPNRVHYAPSPADAVIEAFLEASGLSGRDEGPSDLWSLAPWLHGRGVWARALGAETFARFVEARILVRTQSRAVAHPEHRAAGRTLIAFPHGGGHYGVSEDEDVAPALLTGDALDTWQLDVVGLGRHVARGLGLEGAVRGDLPIEGLVDLGFRHVGSVVVQVLMAAARPSPKGLRELVFALTSGKRSVVLVPADRSTGAGVTEVSFDPAGPPEGTLRAILLAHELADEVPAILVAPLAARVVVDTTRRLAWLDRVPLELSDTDFALLAALARAAGAIVSSAAIAKAVASGPRDGSSVPKQKARLMIAIRESFDRAGRAMPAKLDRLIVPASKQGYRLTVEAHVR
jgi:hypothetical protein